MPDSGAKISAASRVYRMTLRGSGIESTMRPPARLASLDRQRCGPLAQKAGIRPVKMTSPWRRFLRKNTGQ